jgi:FlaA1/EpsC-like NDP-sugar epimerase
MRTARGESLLLQALDLLLAGGCMAGAYVLRFWFDVGLLPAALPAASYAEGVAVALAVTHIVLRARGLYDTTPARGFDAVEETWRGVTLAAVVVLALSFFERDSIYSRSLVLLAWALQCLVLPVPRLLLLTRRRRRYARGQDLVPCLLIGSPRRVLELHQRLHGHRRYGLSIAGLLPTEAPDPGAAPPVPWVGASLADLEPALARTGAREVLISDTLERLPLLEVLETCERLGVEARVVPCIYDLFILPRDLTELHGVALVSVRERRFEVVSRALKRAFDLVAGGALLLLASPLLAVVCLLIRRESPGPALFGQRRIGEAGRPFSMWKLRSMVQDAEARLKELVDLDKLREPVFKLENDPRITRVGRWIRRWWAS